MEKTSLLKTLSAALIMMALIAPATAADPALQDGLFAYWNFDDGSGLQAVDSINGNNAVLDPSPGTPSWTTGKLGGALSFDGIDDVAYPPSGGTMDPASEGMTISAWVNLNEYPSLMVDAFDAIMDSNDDSYILYLDRGNSEIRCKFTASDAEGNYMGIARPGVNEINFYTYEWLHVASTFDGTTAKIYLNGELEDTHIITGPGGQIASGQQLGFGMQPGNPDAEPPTDPSAPYSGMLDDVGLWNRPLSDVEIAHLYNGGTGRAITATNPTLAPNPTAVPDPVLHYNFEGNLNNEGTGGATYNGTLVGATGTMSYISGATADSGQAMDLAQAAQNPADGVHMEVGYTMPEEGTMMFWAKPGDFYNYLALIDNNVEANDWEMWVYDTGVARFRIQDSSVVSQDLNALDGPNEWYHFAMNWFKNADSDTVSLGLHVNGEQVTGDEGVWVTPGTAFGIGGGLLNGAGNVAFDDFRLYEATLTADQIKEIVGIQDLMPGDANGDGYVDVTDLGILATNYGAGGGFGWEDADFTGDGLVDVNDLGILATNYGSGPASAVPEPGSIALLLGACLACLALPRRKIR